MTLAAVRRFPRSPFAALAMSSMMALGMSAESPAQMAEACELDAPSRRAGRLDVLPGGASGMIGSRIAREAASRGHCVVGGAASLNLPDGTPLIDTLPKQFQTGEPLGMRNVLQSLKASDIDWTFFSPPLSIKPGARTGKYQLGTSILLRDAKGESNISAEDFAHALVNELEKPAHRRSQMTIAY